MKAAMREPGKQEKLKFGFGSVGGFRVAEHIGQNSQTCGITGGLFQSAERQMNE